MFVSKKKYEKALQDLEIIKKENESVLKRNKILNDFIYKYERDIKYNSLYISQLTEKHKNESLKMRQWYKNRYKRYLEFIKED